MHIIKETEALYTDISQLIDNSKQRLAIAVNTELPMLYWQVGSHTDLVFKSTYFLDFLSLQNTYSEKNLEDALITHLQQFIQELGNGFAFLERQKCIMIDGEDYHLDLLFYHRKLKRLVAIDLKLGKFKPQYKANILQNCRVRNGLLRNYIERLKLPK